MADYIKDEPGFKTVTLTQSYVVFDKSFDKVRLKSPTYKHIYVEGLGAPVEWQPVAGGGQMIITNYEAIAKYLDRIAVEPTSESLNDLSPIDARRLETAVTDFFREPKKESSSAGG
jgi:hypothetical protein